MITYIYILLGYKFPSVASYSLSAERDSVSSSQGRGLCSCATLPVDAVSRHVASSVEAPR